MTENLSNSACDCTMILDLHFLHNAIEYTMTRSQLSDKTYTTEREGSLAIAPYAISKLNSQDNFRDPTLTLGLH